MRTPRLIPVLTLIEDRAVKTKSFKEPRYVGDPVNTTALLSSYETEELLVLDISDSFGMPRTSNLVLSQIVENAFMPIGFGGGIRSIDDAKKVFEIGFDKVILRTELFNQNLVASIVAEYGSQAVSGCIDVNLDLSSLENNKISLNGVEYLSNEVDEVFTQLSNSGVGELIVHDIKIEGTREGLRSHSFLNHALSSLKIPVVALGGCKDLSDASRFIVQTGCHSIAGSTMFFFNSTRDSVLINYPSHDTWVRELEIQK
jgi:cyclase